MINNKDSFLTQKYDVEILTPIHIGGASENHWQKGIDFISKDEKTWLLSLDKLFEHFSPKELSAIYSNPSENETLENKLTDNLLESLATKVFNIKVTGKEIKRHIFGGAYGKPYIPGSSLKGAFSSILLNYFYSLNKKTYKIDGNINEAVLGNFENSIMKFFQFSDVQFEDTYLVNTKIFNLQDHTQPKGGKLGDWYGGWKHGFNSFDNTKKGTNRTFNGTSFTTFYESLIPNKKGSMTLSFKKKLVEQLFEAKKTNKELIVPNKSAETWLTNNPIKKLADIINKHTITHLKKEILFFENYAFDDQSKSALESLKKLKVLTEELVNSESFIFRLAAGSGFHSITGDWQYEDYFGQIGVWTEGDSRNKLCKRGDVGKQKYKSRKIAFENGIFQPMGFIKLSVKKNIIYHTPKETKIEAKEPLKKVKAKSLKSILKKK